MALDRVVLTRKEHNEFKHLCGWTGVEVELFSNFCLVSCEKARECQLGHCVKPADEMSDEVYINAVDWWIRLGRWVV